MSGKPSAPLPPRLARWLIACIAGRSFGGRGIVQELDDEFADRAREDARAARRWYRRESAGMVWRAGAIRSPGDSLMTRLALDARFAIRALLKQPRFTLLASLTLALGVGAVTVIFSIANGVLLRPLPYAHADRLVNLKSQAPKLGYDQFPSSPDLYILFEKDTSLFESAATWQTSRSNLTGAGAPDVIRGIETTSTYFDTLGIRLARGRAFTMAEDQPNGPRLVVISDRLWRTRLGANRDIVGQSIQLDGKATQVIGVTTPEIDEAGSPDYFLPVQLDRANPPQGNFGWEVVARTKPDIALPAIDTRLSDATRQYGEAMQSPAYRAFLLDGGFSVHAISLKEDLVGNLERPLWILLGTVGLLLAIACANVANLFLVRAEGRQLEIAVRTALGGRRATLVRGLMVEAVVLSLVGSALGVVVAALALPSLIRLAPPALPRLDQIAIDWHVLLFAAGVAVLSALLFGLVPALRYTRPASMTVLRQGGRGGTGDPARRRMRSALVVLQTAIAVVLLVGSGLLARSFAKLGATSPGFEPRDVMTFRIALPDASYPDRERRLQFVQQLNERLVALPGVAEAGASTNLPLSNSSPGTAHEIESRPVQPGQLPPIVHYESVSGHYFEAMKIPLTRGRLFTSADYAPGATNVLVNDAMASHFWPGEDALGKRLRVYSTDTANPTPWFTVVGVVGSVHGDSLRLPARGLVFYAGTVPNGTNAPQNWQFAVRGSGLTSRADDLRRAVWAIDPTLPVASTQPMTSIVSQSMVEFTFTMLTLGIASALALALGSIGLYGVLSYAVMLQTREIGVRLALGATPTNVMRRVVTNGVVLATIGIVIGLAGAWALTGYMGELLFETTPLDPATFAGMSAAMLAVAALASFLPARRAARVSPLESMKAT
jgi:predicted permease